MILLVIFVGNFMVRVNVIFDFKKRFVIVEYLVLIVMLGVRVVGVVVWFVDNENFLL